jgi:hypothetical protein
MLAIEDIVGLLSGPLSRDTLHGIFADALEYRLQAFDAAVSQRVPTQRLVPSDATHVDAVAKALALMIAEGNSLAKDHKLVKVKNDDELVGARVALRLAPQVDVRTGTCLAGPEPPSSSLVVGCAGVLPILPL